MEHNTEGRIQGDTLRYGLGRFRSVFLELLVVIIGVLIALAVDAWYDERIEVRSERAFLEQLIEDLQETERQLVAADARNLESEKSTARLLVAFSAAEQPTAESIRAWLAKVRDIDNPVPVIATAEALIATGDIRLIQDVNSRAAINRWLSRVRDYWLVPVYQLEESHRSQYHTLAGVVDFMAVPVRDRAIADALSGYMQPDVSPFPFDADEFFQDRGTYAILSELYYLKIGMRRFRAAMQADAAELRAILEASVDER